MNIMPVNKNEMPYSADIRIQGTTYTFTFNYNAEGDFFTVDLTRNGEILVLGEKVVYGSPLFASYLDERFPLSPVIPVDLSAQSERVGWQELNESVFLFTLSAVELEATADE